MKLSFYFDEMMPRSVAAALEVRGFVVVMAVDVEMVEKDDLAEHLAYASAQGAVLVTRDKPFATRALSVANHAGLICWTGKQDDIGGMVRRLVDFGDTHTSEQAVQQVFWLK